MKKTFEVIKTVLTWLIVLLAVCMMVFTIVSVTTFDRNDRALFGYKMYIVRSDSMSATDFKAGDLILVRSVDPTTLQPGDIIAFTSQDSANFGETVTHKIRSLTTDADGQPAFITYGTTTDTDDEMPVTYPYVLGKYEKCLSGVGNFFQFLKTTPGYILCIFLPFFLLILMEGINCVRLFKRYKSEEQREIQAQQANLERQREENQRMMQELMEMKARLEEKVPIRLFKDNDRYKDDVYVCVNGERLLIKRGENVEIPRKFALVLEQSAQQDTATANLIEQKSTTFAAEAAAHNV